VRRQEECRSLNAAIAYAFQKFETGHAGHRNVENETVEPSRDCGFESGHAAFSFLDLKAEAAEVLREQQSHVRIVICDQKTLACVFAVWWCLLCQMSDPCREGILLTFQMNGRL
jgi:hypothetical protein